MPLVPISPKRKRLAKRVFVEHSMYFKNKKFSRLVSLEIHVLARPAMHNGMADSYTMCKAKLLLLNQLLIHIG